RGKTKAPAALRGNLAWHRRCGAPLRGRRPGEGRNVRPPTGAHRPGPPYMGDTITGAPAMFTTRKKLEMPTAADALPGRPDPIPTAKTHFINGNALKGPYPEGLEMAMFGMGCFWGAERKFWELGDGIHVTAAGYAGGVTPHPSQQAA